MAGLLSIFILALVYFILNFTQARAQLVENDVKLSQMLTDIQFGMKSKGIEIKIDPSHGVLTLPEGVLFDVGEAYSAQNKHLDRFRLNTLTAPN